MFGALSACSELTVSKAGFTERKCGFPLFNSNPTIEMVLNFPDALHMSGGPRYDMQTRRGAGAMGQTDDDSTLSGA